MPKVLTGVHRQVTADLARLLGRLDTLPERLETAEAAWSEWLAAVAADYHASARNIVRYWAIRQIDLRELQHQLAGSGLSSLGRSEPDVEATRRIVGSAVMAMPKDGRQPAIASAVGADEGGELLRSRTVDLLGPVPADRETRIMITLPSEAATDPLLVRPQLERGMDVARRAKRTPCCHNCIHGISTICPRWCPWIPK